MAKPEAPRIRGVFLSDFQSIKSPTYIDLCGITLLYGPNSAGKSAFVDALKFLRKISKAEPNNFNIDYLWREYCNYSTRLGVSFIARNPRSLSSEAENWWAYRDEFGLQSHHDFFREIEGRFIQLELFDCAYGLRLAIDGIPLFELSSKSRHFTPFYVPTESLEEALFGNGSDEGLDGCFTFFRDHPLASRLLPFLCESISARHSSTQVTPVFIEETESAITIWGIHIDESLYGSGLGAVGPWFLEGVINPDFSHEYWRSSELPLEQREFISKYFLRDDEFQREQRRGRVELQRFIEETAEAIDPIARGLILMLRESLEFGHVEGDRQILDSRMPAFVSERTRLSKALPPNVFHESLRVYAEAASSDFKSYPLGLLATARVSHDFINEAIRECLNSLRGYSVVAEVHSVQMKTKETRSEERWPNNEEDYVVCWLNVKTQSGAVLGFQEVGSGLSYVLPILSSLWASWLSVVEQPELHLHPAGQCELGDVFIFGFASGSYSVVESHSEHLLLRLLRRIRETSTGRIQNKKLALKPEQLAVYYFNPDGGGNTQVHRLRVDRHGEFLDFWPGGFFAERDSELFG